MSFRDSDFEDDKGCLKRDGGEQETENVEKRMAKIQPAVTCGKVGVCWCPGTFSQAHMGVSTEGSNACTIIALMVAETCHSEGLTLFVNPPRNKPTIDAFAQCIVEGNTLHQSLWRKKKLKHLNLSVPEAFKAAGDRVKHIVEWAGIVSQQDIYECLYQDLREKTQEWYDNTPQDCVSDLYVVLIADSTSVLLVFQEEMDTVTLLDSHQHYNQTGAAIAQVAKGSLHALCSWYVTLLSRCYDSRPTAYELSYLYFRRCDDNDTPPA